MAKAKIQGSTQQQRLFAYNYFHNGGNASKAAIDAGYAKKAAPQIASRLLTYAKVQEIIENLNQKLEKKAIVTKERLINELESIALFDLRTLYDENGALLPVKDLSPAAGAAITGIEIMEEFDGTGKDRVHIGNTVKIKMNSKISAIDSILDTMGWKAPKKISSTDPEGNAVTPPMTDTQVNDILLALRKKK